jgi:hypothetical protein
MQHEPNPEIVIVKPATSAVARPVFVAMCRRILFAVPVSCSPGSTSNTVRCSAPPQPRRRPSRRCRCRCRRLSCTPCHESEMICHDARSADSSSSLRVQIRRTSLHSRLHATCCRRARSHCSFVFSPCDQASAVHCAITLVIHAARPNFMFLAFTDGRTRFAPQSSSNDQHVGRREVACHYFLISSGPMRFADGGDRSRCSPQ